MTTGTLYGVGTGPGDPQLVTRRAWSLVESAQVIAYPAPETGDSLARAIAAPHLRADATEIAIRMPLSSNR
ncbi:MAG: SAM-dependent methyltransferase, partial [Candidatus Puniceispirillaceae bacterium]